MNVALIDYGAGNLRSIENAVKKVGGKVSVTRKPEELSDASAIILPGVGSFGSAMERLKGFKKPLTKAVEEGVPFLGLCLGIQVILDESEESPDVSGLGLIQGTCTRFTGELKVPHMGWNSIQINKKIPLLAGLGDDSFFYFVHSYYPKPTKEEVVAASTEYGVDFPSIIASDNLYATQFHPEKSGPQGLTILENFINLI